MKGNNFQLIIIIVFIVAAMLGLLVFSGVIPIGDSNTKSTGSVVVWGTAKKEVVAKAVEDYNTLNPNYTIKYIQKYPETFDQDLLEALASGKGPDVFFLTDDLAYKYSNKIFKIPYQSYPLATFKNNFAGAGEVFLTSGGILAFPMTIDPLVMYYNRSMFDANDVVFPPASWEDLTEVVPILLKKDDTGKVTQSTVAMGQFVNVSHAKDIIATLFMQVGNTITKEENGFFRSAIAGDVNITNTEKMLTYYTSFSDPSVSVYSWNRSFAKSIDSFSAEKLAIYFGYASELRSLVNKNPNHNFMVAPMPQIKNSKYKVTLGHVTGLAVSAFSKNFNNAFTAASLMTTGNFAKQYAEAVEEVPARRDLLSEKNVDSFSPTFYSSALFAKSWLDPSGVETDKIFRVMVDNILSGNMSSENSIKDADAKLNLLFTK